MTEDEFFELLSDEELDEYYREMSEPDPDESEHIWDYPTTDGMP